MVVPPEPIEVSPKFHVNVYGGVPPLADAVNVTSVPFTGLDGDEVKLADRGGTPDESFHAVNGCNSQCPPLVELPLSQNTKP